jgi:hypothetical protein
MTKFFTILLIHVGAASYSVTMPSQAECSDALLIVSDAADELSALGDGGEVWAQCHKTDSLSASVRPRARGDL